MMVRSGAAGWWRRGVLSTRLFCARRRLLGRRRIGEDHIGLAIDGLEARSLGVGRRRHLLGQIEHVVRWRQNPAGRCVEAGQHRIDAALIHDGGFFDGRRRRRGLAWRRRRNRRRRHRLAGRHRSRARRCRWRSGRLCGRGLGGIVIGDDAANGGEDLLHRGLLRLRRLAHCRNPTISPRPHRNRGACGESPAHSDMYSERRKYGMAVFERKRRLVDTSGIRRGRYFPSGVRTPSQTSRT